MHHSSRLIGDRSHGATIVLTGVEASDPRDPLDNSCGQLKYLKADVSEQYLDELLSSLMRQSRVALKPPTITMLKDEDLTPHPQSILSLTRSMLSTSTTCGM